MIELTRAPLVPDAITAKVKADRNGGVVTFLGTTRGASEGRRVLHLEYEAYPEMAKKKLEEIRQEVKENWGIEDVAISHRLGRLEIEDISLVVAVAAAHRKEAFQVCHYVVDRVKQIVPIWKKEFFEDGSHWVGCQEGGEGTMPSPF